MFKIKKGKRNENDDAISETTTTSQSTQPPSLTAPISAVVVT